MLDRSCLGLSFSFILVLLLNLEKMVNFFLKEGGVVIIALGLGHVVTNFCTAERAILGLRKETQKMEATR